MERTYLKLSKDMSVSLTQSKAVRRYLLSDGKG